MGLRLISKENVGASAKLPLALPVKDGFIGAYLTYDNADQLEINYKNVERVATVAGAPVVDINKTTFTGNVNYVETPHTDTEGFTIFAVAKSGEIESGKQALVFGNYGTGVSGVTLYFTGANVNVSASYASGLKQATRTKNTDTALYVARGASNLLDISDKTAGQRAYATVNESRVLSGRKYRIGSGHGVANMDQSCDVSLSIVYSRTLSDSEVEEVCASIRKLMDSIGVAV